MKSNFIKIYLEIFLRVRYVFLERANNNLKVSTSNRFPLLDKSTSLIISYVNLSISRKLTYLS